MPEEINNDFLVNYLIDNGVLRSETLINAFRKIDKPASSSLLAPENADLPISL